MSAPDEMEYAMSDCPYKPDFDPKILAKVQFDDTTLQELPIKCLELVVMIGLPPCTIDLPGPSPTLAFEKNLRLLITNF